jgi:hypothetical protein
MFSGNRDEIFDFIEGGLPDSLYFEQVGYGLERTVLSAVRDDILGERVSDAWKGRQKPCVRCVDIDTLRRRIRDRIGNGQGDLGEYCSVLEPTGGPQEVAKRILLAEKIETRVVDSASDKDASGENRSVVQGADFDGNG